MRTFCRLLIIPALIAPGLMAQDSFHVKVVGTGQPMILIPGLSSGGETWDSTVARYSNRFQCHVLTLAGFAGVPRFDVPEGMMLPKVEDDLAVYIRSKSLVKPILVGHSLGGFIVLDFAVRYPGVASRLIIVDAYPFTLGMNPTMTPALAKTIAAQMRNGILGITPEAWAANAKTGTSTNNLVTSEADQKRLIDWAMSSDRASVADALGEMMGADLREKIGSITIPALILGAWRGSEGYGASHEVVEKNMRDQYAKLAGAQIYVNDTSRHFIMWDDPQWMFRSFDRFLAVK